MGLNTSAIERVCASARRLDTSLILLLIAVAAETTGDHQTLASSVECYFDHQFQPERLYEALLQTYLFAGFPAAIEGLTVARRCAIARRIPFGTTHAEDYDISHFLERGRVVFARVYGDKHQRLRERIHELSPELDSWMMIEGYGKVLARPVGLSFVEREYCAVAALATGGWVRQLRSHMHALAREGVTFEEMLDALDAIALVATPDRIESAHHIAESLWH